jgi:hypothetical protein
LMRDGRKPIMLWVVCPYPHAPPLRHRLADDPGA